MKSKDQQLLEEAYIKVLKEEYVDVSKFRSFSNLKSNTQDALSQIAAKFQISNLKANMWERDAMAAAYQYGLEKGMEAARVDSANK